MDQKFKLKRIRIPNFEFFLSPTPQSIVNVSSIAGLRAYPGALPYKMSKAAMDQLTRCSALELAPKGQPFILAFCFPLALFV